VERAVREIHNAADTKYQRQAERDQEVVASEYEAVDHLFQQEHESKTISARCDGGSSTSSADTIDGASANGRPRPVPDHKVQGFCSFVGLMTSSGSFAFGIAGLSARKSHLSLAWPLGLTVKG